MDQTGTPAATPPHATLEREARYLHLALFGRPPPQSLVLLYLAAHLERVDLFDAPEHDMNALARIVARRLDATGIELRLRRRGRRHLLSRKLLLVSYIAECDGRHPEPRRVPGGMLPAYAALLVNGLRAATRMLRGRFQAWRHGIV